MPSLENPNENTIPEIRDFFDETPGMPLKPMEFIEFWRSLSDKERSEFRKANLKA